MKDFFEQLYNQLAERERRLLLLFAPPIVLILIYVLLWRPFDQRVERLQLRVAEQQSLLTWMQSSAVEVKLLRRQSGARSKVSKQSLLVLVDKTIRKAGLSKALKRVEPDGASKVKVRLEQADFDAVTKWLETMQRRHGVTIKNVNIDRQDDVGVVNIRLIIVGGG